MQNNTGGSSPFSALWEKANNIKLSKTGWIIVIGACVAMIIGRKLNLKPKKLNFDWGGKK